MTIADDLIAKFSQQQPSNNGVDVDGLISKFAPSVNNQQQQQPQSSDISQMQEYNRESFVRGISDVLDTAMHGLGSAAEFVGDNFLPADVAQSIREENQEFNAADLAKRQKYEQTNPNAQGFDVSRTLGQVATTLPLMPTKAIQLWKGAVGALPTIAATGEKIAAPFVNRLVGAVGEGALGGATYGAATAGSNDNSTLQNIGQGLITGAMAGPLLHTAGEVASNVAPSLSSLWAKVNVSQLAQNSGIAPNVAQNVIDRLSAAGYTPMDAQAELNKLGPKATLMDLDNSLTTEGSGLAALGDRPTAILKNRMEARATTANNDTVNIINNTLGPRPDIDDLKTQAIKNAQAAVKPDYQAAYDSGDVLDTSDIADGINKQLETAIGGKRNALMAIKNWLFKDAEMPDGTTQKILKYSIPDLHEIRMGLDDVIEGKEPDTSAGKNALNSVKNIRGQIDDLLKTNPQFAAADVKFANEMKVVQGFDIGKDAITKKTTAPDFAKIYNAANPETKDTISKGMLSAVYDYLDTAQKGELTGATQLLGKNSAKRTNLNLAFGNNGNTALDALQKEANFRSTENAIRSGSQTAERQAVQARYGMKAKAGINDLVHGAIADLTTSSPGIGTGISLVKRGGSKVLSNIAGNRLETLTSGTADILSQSGNQISKTLDTLDQIAAKQQKVIQPKKINRYKLPVASPAAIGESYLGQNRRQK